MSSCVTKIVTRRWWSDDSYKAELTLRIESEGWKIVLQDGTPAEVIRIVYAGYKIKLPDNTERIVNPDSVQVTDASIYDYPQLVEVWLQKQGILLEQKSLAAAALSAEKEALQLKQLACLHTSTQTVEVMRTSGCDIDDTQCTVCGKLLRRSWSTNSDRDPDDHVSDWAWWCREHQRLYNQQPTIANYKVVDSIDSV